MRTSLNRQENIALIYRIAPDLKNIPVEEIDSLAECLGDMPSALDLAGRTLAARPYISVQQYRTEIEKTISAFSPTLQDWLKGNTFPYITDLAAVLVIALQALPRDGLARSLFSIAIYCTPDINIPNELLKKALGCSDAHQAEYEGALRQLYLLGLLENTGHGPKAHAHIAGIADRVIDQSESMLACLAEALIELSTPDKALPASSPIWPHLRTVAERCGRMEMKQAGKIWNSLGYHLWLAGEYSPAQVCFERALAIEEKMIGPQHPEIAALQNNLGHVLCDLGNLKGAKNCFRQALAIHESADGYGPKHPSVAADSINLGGVLFRLGDIEGAKTCYELALAINELCFGLHHLNVAAAVGKLGQVLHAKGEAARAKACFERQLNIEESAYGQQHPSLASTLNNLGLALQDLGQLPKAQVCFERALMLDEEACGPNHLNIARDLNNLGSILREIGDLPKARVLFRQALVTTEKVEGPHSRDIAITANNLARVLYSLDDLEGARECFERVLAIDEACCGSASSEVASDLTNLGIIQHELGDLKRARASYERALGILEKTLPNHHLRMITVRKYLDRLKITASSEAPF